MFAAVDRAARINGAVHRHHANATIQRVGDVQAWSVLYACNAPDSSSPFADVVTTPTHSISMCVINVPDLAEGDKLTVTHSQWPTGQLCRVTTPVVPDAGGWASFVVVPLEGDNDV